MTDREAVHLSPTKDEPRLCTPSHRAKLQRVCPPRHTNRPVILEHRATRGGKLRVLPGLCGTPGNRAKLKPKHHNDLQRRPKTPPRQNPKIPEHETLLPEHPFREPSKTHRAPRGVAPTFGASAAFSRRSIHGRMSVRRSRRRPSGESTVCKAGSKRCPNPCARKKHLHRTARSDHVMNNASRAGGFCPPPEAKPSEYRLTTAHETWGHQRLAITR